MHRMIAFAWLMVIVAALQAPGHSGENLVRNPGFDAGGTTPEGWEKTMNIEMIRDTKMFKKGPASLCITCDGKDGNANQKVKGLAGKRVRISGFAKCEGGLTSAQVFTLTFDKKWKNLGWGMVYVIQPGPWKAFEKTVSFPDKAGVVLVGLFAKGKGKAWLDEISVVAAGAGEGEGGAEAGGEDPEKQKAYDLNKFQGPNPKAKHLGAVASDILCLLVREYFNQYGSFGPYKPEPGDEITEKGIHRILKRKGKAIGNIAGPEGNLHLKVWDQRTGKPLQLRAALNPANYALNAGDGGAIKVTKVFRKTRPVDQTKRGYCREHFLFLKLAKPMSLDAKYTLSCGSVNIDPGKHEFVFDPKRLRSEAVHVNQVGFRSDDPAKLGFLSLWMGTGGAYTGYKEGTAFHLVDVKSGKAIHSGKVALRTKRTQKAFGYQAKGRNFELTNTYVCDFSSFATPGEYALSVDGVGCSYPFVIGEKSWQVAWHTSMRGFYHQRSGIEWKKPYAAWDRPRDLHPADGKHNAVYEVTKTELDLGMDLKQLPKIKTDKTLPEAWGGYHDAGDYDRRVYHLVCSRYMMELFDLFPDYFRKQKLLLPEEKNALPDILDEGLWCPALYKRIQREDGGVRGGIETNGHPRHGEASHLDTLTKFVFKPDVRASWTFAATAAQAAWLLRREKQAQMADDWQAAAVKAMKWAEAQYKAGKDAYHQRKNWWQIKDKRNLAAAHLYRLTRDRAWHEVFLATCGYKDMDKPNVFKWSSHVQSEAAIVYARLGEGLGDPAVKVKAKQALIAHADQQVTYASKQAYMFTAKDMGSPLIISSHAAPQGLDICRAHFLTGDRKYLEWAIKSSQFSVGGNPLNLVMTTGLGSRSVMFPLYLDMKYMSQKAPPPGITIYGILDPKFGKPNWAHKWILDHENNCVPSWREWPLSEFYFDVYTWPMENEFTVQQSMAPACYVWGYLAARK